MTIEELCGKIGLQTDVWQQICTAADSFDVTFMDGLLEEMYDEEKMRSIHLTIQSVLGEDPGNMKMLCCMLYASAAAWEHYQASGISEDVYIATMKCYPRFLSETYGRTGKWEFDRFWWTARQAGCHLFRIGELEYERKYYKGEPVIGIHIPSDADFSPSAVDTSLAAADAFFKVHYPELFGCDYICHSWLLDQQLRKMLKDSSNIVHFQKRFEIIDEGEANTEFLEWLFRTTGGSYADLPENTSLQRAVKQHICAGGVIHNSYGRLYRD